MSTVVVDPDSRGPSVLQWVSMVGIVAVAVMRVVTTFNPQVVFASDPVADPTPIAGLGPVGSMTLDVILMLLAGLGMLAETLRGRGVELKLLLLGLLPIPFVLLHGAGDIEDLWRGATWVSAAMAAVAVIHLARERQLQGVLIAGLAATCIPLGLRGLMQVYIEHPAVVELYQSDRDHWLSVQGIDPESNAALIFERRLMQPEASGWFGFSNVFGSFMMFGLLTFGGLLIASLRVRLAGGVVGLMGIFAMLAGFGLYLSHSRGAAVAVCLGAVILMAPLAPRLGATLQRRAGLVALLVVVLTILSVVACGLLLPEDFVGGSILFRWHYWLAASRMLMDAPVAGVGPGSFQTAYVLLREAVSPEEVASPHSMFIDWATMLGVGGLGLVGLASLMLWRTAQAGGDSFQEVPDEHEEAADPTRQWILPVSLMVTAIALVPAFWFEQATLDMFTRLVRVAGVLGFLVGMATVLNVWMIAGNGWARWGLVAGTIGIVAHGQIEMSFTQPGSAVWCWLLLASLAVPRVGAEPGLGVARGRFAGAAVLMIGIGIGIMFVRPAWQQQRIMARAAEPLLQIGREWLDLKDVSRATGLANLREREAVAREAAIDRLIEAQDIFLANPAPLLVASQQAAIAASLASGNDRETLLAKSAELAAWSWENSALPRALAMVAQTNAELARSGIETGLSWRRAIDARRLLTKMDPQGVHTHFALAEMLWESGDVDAAATVYAHTLELNPNWYLDDLKQLQGADLRRATERARRDTAGGG